MPAYEYECEKCGARTTTVLKSWRELDDHREWCICGSPYPMDRQPSAPSFVVQGFNARNGYSQRQH